MFRDLEKFNQGFIAKKVWRLFRRPGSLFENVLRDSYYPNGNLFEAKGGSDASSLWRSLWFGKEVIDAGSR